MALVAFGAYMGSKQVNEDLEAMDGLCTKIAEQRDRIEALEVALKPFAQNVKAASLSKALGHITREHLLNASAALDRDTG
jgi:hypothetical protein